MPDDKLSRFELDTKKIATLNQLRTNSLVSQGRAFIYDDYKPHYDLIDEEIGAWFGYDWDSEMVMNVLPSVNRESTIFESYPLRFDILGDGYIQWKSAEGWNVDIEYSTDGGSTWTTITSSYNNPPQIPVNSGDTVLFRGNNDTYYISSGNLWCNFSGSAPFNLSGNITELLSSQSRQTMPEGVFTRLFAESYVINASGLTLPSASLAPCCYMSMFEGCTNLTSAPDLPATTLATYCYDSMFAGCTSLTTAPVLPATTLATYCYESMFYNCSSLNYIKCLATDVSASACTYNWVHGVASNGTFVKDVNMEDWTTGDNGVPTGWEFPKLDVNLSFANATVNALSTDGTMAVQSVTSSVQGLSYTYSSSNSSVATINGSTITIIGGGSTTITATFAGNASYNSASTSYVLSVSKVDVTLSFTNPIVNDTMGTNTVAVQTVNSSAQGVTPITYSSSDSNVATISGTNITKKNVGTTTITATFAGNAKYNPASASYTMAIAKGTVNLSYTNQTVNTEVSAQTVTVQAPNSNVTGLSYTYSSSNSSVATVNGNTITLVGAGTATITATFAGNTNYNSASASYTLNVSKTNVTLSFSNSTVSATTDTSTMSVQTVTSSVQGLTITYSSNNGSVATIVGTTITLVGAGTATITATFAGNSYYNSATASYTLNVSEIYNFSYTGAVQNRTLDAGTYKLEVWGAQGGSYSSTSGGKGGYSVGTINIPSQTTVYVYVGGQGAGANTATALAGGFNGGGNGYGGSGSYGSSYYFGSGGGASDVRIGQDSLYARVIVAGGGGGCGSQSTSTSRRYAGGYGGGTSGGAGSQRNTSYLAGTGGSQTEAGTSYNGTAANPTNYGASLAAFGTGGGRTSGTNRTAGGGGGWYGGGFSASGGGGGGSGYVYTSSTKSNYPSGKLITDDSLLTSTTITAGNGSMPKTDGSGNETGHSGNGYARITKV